MPTPKEELLSLVTTSSLSQTTQDFFTKKITQEGATPANIIALRELLRAVKQQVVSDIGIDINTDDPASVKAAQAQFNTQITAATDAYTSTMKRLEKDAERLTSDIAEDLKNLEQAVIDSAKIEA